MLLILLLLMCGATSACLPGGIGGLGGLGGLGGGSGCGPHSPSGCSFSAFSSSFSPSSPYAAPAPQQSYSLHPAPPPPPPPPPPLYLAPSGPQASFSVDSPPQHQWSVSSENPIGGGVSGGGAYLAPGQQAGAEIATVPGSTYSLTGVSVPVTTGVAIGGGAVGGGAPIGSGSGPGAASGPYIGQGASAGSGVAIGSGALPLGPQPPAIGTGAQVGGMTIGGGAQVGGAYSGPREEVGGATGPPAPPTRGFQHFVQIGSGTLPASYFQVAAPPAPPPEAGSLLFSTDPAHLPQTNSASAYQENPSVLVAGPYSKEIGPPILEQSHHNAGLVQNIEETSKSASSYGLPASYHQASSSQGSSGPFASTVLNALRAGKRIPLKKKLKEINSKAKLGHDPVVLPMHGFSIEPTVTEVSAGKYIISHNSEAVPEDTSVEIEPKLGSYGQTRNLTQGMGFSGGATSGSEQSDLLAASSRLLANASVDDTLLKQPLLPPEELRELLEKEAGSHTGPLPPHYDPAPSQPQIDENSVTQFFNEGVDRSQSGGHAHETGAGPGTEVGDERAELEGHSDSAHLAPGQSESAHLEADHSGGAQVEVPGSAYVTEAAHTEEHAEVVQPMVTTNQNEAESGGRPSGPYGAYAAPTHVRENRDGQQYAAVLKEGQEERKGVVSQSPYLTYYNQMCNGEAIGSSEEETIKSAMEKCALLDCVAANANPIGHGKYKVVFLRRATSRSNRRGVYCVSGTMLPLRRARFERRKARLSPSKASMRIRRLDVPEYKRS